MRTRKAATRRTTRWARDHGARGRGLANDEIAGRLAISTATARTHVSRAMIKLGARDRAQLAVFAYQSGLLGQL
ncbi:response regulator transcription factor [Actinoplanes hulinensis]|uniref:response regulator transcription factor n=1 Tax=Actinoplanes hulinensis TaxID=1144547 RepID=UPI003557C64E